MVQILTNKICVKLSTMHLMWLLSHKYVPSSINKLENLMGLIWTHTDRCTITINGNGNAKLLWYMYKYTRSYMNCHFISTFMNTCLRHLVLAVVMMFPGKFHKKAYIKMTIKVRFFLYYMYMLIEKETCNTHFYKTIL